MTGAAPRPRAGSVPGGLGRRVHPDRVGVVVVGDSGRAALAVAPDLVAVRPLLDVASTGLVGSAAFSPIVRAAARRVHGVFTGQASGYVALRLVDVGSALAGLRPAIAPQAAARLPDDLSVTVERVGNSSVAARPMRVARLVGVLARLLPVLAAACIALGVGLARDRHRATVRTGWGMTAAGARWSASSRSAAPCSRRRWARIGRGAVFAVLGIVALFRPLLIVTALGVLAGLMRPASIGCRTGLTPIRGRPRSGAP